MMNPLQALDCTKWCEYAMQCAGVTGRQTGHSSFSETTLASRLLQAVAEEIQHDPTRLTQVLLVFQHARELLTVTGGNARVVLAAALLLETSADGYGDRESTAERILRGVGIDEETIRQVCELIRCLQDHRPSETVEYQALMDARRLAHLTWENSGIDPQRLETIISTEFLTQAAKQRARELFQSKCSPGFSC